MTKHGMLKKKLENQDHFDFEEIEDWNYYEINVSITNANLPNQQNKKI